MFSFIQTISIAARSEKLCTRVSSLQVIRSNTFLYRCKVMRPFFSFSFYPSHTKPPRSIEHSPHSSHASHSSHSILSQRLSLASLSCSWSSSSSRPPPHSPYFHHPTLGPRLSLGPPFAALVALSDSLSWRAGLCRRGLGNNPPTSRATSTAMRCTEADDELIPVIPRGGPDERVPFVPKHMIQVQYARSSGAGGQNVNKVETKCEIRVKVGNLGLSEDIEARLREAVGNKINKEDELIIVNQETRSRLNNYNNCIQKLTEIMTTASIKPKDWNKNSKTKKKFKENRLDAKKRNSEKKQSRRRGFDDY